MYYCRVVYVLLYIPMKTEGGVHGPQDPTPESAPALYGFEATSESECGGRI